MAHWIRLRAARSALAPIFCCALALALAGCDDYAEETLERLPTDAGEQGLLESTETIGGTFEDGYRLHLENRELNAGPLAFRVANTTDEEHSLAIRGDPAPAGPPTVIPAGEIRTVEVELAPGPKVIYCPVKDHAERGERVDVTVGD